MGKLETRVARIAETTLAEQQVVRAIDILVGLGWLAQPNVDRWERGRGPALERGGSVGADKVTAALAPLRKWAQDRGLTPTQVDYQDLQFCDDNADAELAYRPHWASPDDPH